MYGPVANHHVAELEDINAREFVVLGMLAIGVLALGVWPQPLLEVMQATVGHLVEQIVTSKVPL
jgi:NADH-quinone oxidoreductase subunit M